MKETTYAFIGRDQAEAAEKAAAALGTEFILRERRKRTTSSKKGLLGGLFSGRREKSVSYIELIVAPPHGFELPEDPERLAVLREAARRAADADGRGNNHGHAAKSRNAASPKPARARAAEAVPAAPSRAADARPDDAAASAPSASPASSASSATHPASRSAGAPLIRKAYQTPEFDPRGPAAGGVIVDTVFTREQRAGAAGASGMAGMAPIGDNAGLDAGASARLRRAAERGERATANADAGDRDRVIPASPAALTVQERVAALQEQFADFVAREEARYRELRRLLTWRSQGALPLVDEAWLDGYARLVDGGVEASAARALVEGCAVHAPAAARAEEDERLACLAEALAATLSVVRPAAPAASGTSSPGPRVLAFVGPPGQGKSTAVQKMALSLCQKGGARLAVIDVNVEQYHPHSSTAHCARMLGIPHRTVVNVDQARAVFGRHAGAGADAEAPGAFDELGADVVLVDTAGCLPVDPRGVPRLAQILTALKAAEVHLVLGADLDERAARRAVEEYGPLRADRWVMTRMDCARRYPLLAMDGAPGAGWAYLSAGAAPNSAWVAADAEAAAWMLLGVEHMYPEAFHRTRGT